MDAYELGLLGWGFAVIGWSWALRNLLLSNRLDVIVTKQQKEIRVLEELALTDKVTGLYNRRGYEQRLHEAVSHALRAGESLTLLDIDLNDLKMFNSAGGHALGDAVLAALALALSPASSRPADICARDGGDEFKLVLLDTDRAGAVIVIKRLALLIEAAPVLYMGQTIPPRVSIGVATLSHDASARPCVNGEPVPGGTERTHAALKAVETRLRAAANANLFTAKEIKARVNCPVCLGDSSGALDSSEL